MNTDTQHLRFLNKLFDCNGFPEAIAIFRGYCMQKDIDFHLLSNISVKYRQEIERLSPQLGPWHQNIDSIIDEGLPRVLPAGPHYISLMPVVGWHDDLEILIYLLSDEALFTEDFLLLVQKLIRSKYRHPEEALLLSVHQAQYPYFVLDRNSKIVFASHNTEPLFELQAQEVRRIGLPRLFDQESNSKLMHTVLLYNRLIEEGQTEIAPMNLDLHTRHKPDQVLRVRLQSVFDKGQFEYFLVEVGLNLPDKNSTTPTDRLAHEMRNHWDRMVYVFDLASDSILIHNAKGQIFDANQTALKTFGFSSSELQRTSLFALCPALVRTDYLSHSMHEEGIKYEALFFARTGRKIITEVKTKRIGVLEPATYISFIRDITVRTTALQQLEESEARYRTLLETVPCGIMVIQNQAIEYLNPIGAKILGYDNQHDLMGLGAGSQLIKPEWVEAMHAIFRHLESDQRHKPVVVPLQNLGGDKLFLSVSGTQIYYRNAPAYLILAVDITQEKEIENELIAAKRKAEQSDLIKSVFLANISHEIRTPLNAINGFTELLRGESDLSLDQSLRYLDIILDNSNQLISLVSNLLEVSEIHAGRVQLTHYPCQIDTVFEEIYREQTPKRKNLEFVLQKRSPQPLGSMLSDARRLKQIAEILINNAFKFTHYGAVSLAYWTEADRLHFAVNDTGIGIDADKLSDIFKLFHQEELNADNRKYGGTGVGLSLVKGLVDLFGGRIQVSSTKGSGSQFNVSLPLIHEPNADSLEPSSEAVFSWSDQAILIIEDNLASGFFLKEVFEEMVPSIAIEITGKGGLNYLAQHPEVSLVLLDLQLPDYDGLDLVGLIKAQYGLPVIAQTAFALNADREQALARGFDDYLVKPISPKKIIQAAEFLLRQRG